MGLVGVIPVGVVARLPPVVPLALIGVVLELEAILLRIGVLDRVVGTWLLLGGARASVVLAEIGVESPIGGTDLEVERLTGGTELAEAIGPEDVGWARGVDGPGVVYVDMVCLTCVEWMELFGSVGLGEVPVLFVPLASGPRLLSSPCVVPPR